MAHEIDPQLLKDVEAKFGANGPVLYLIAFNKEGEGLLFTRSDLGPKVDTYRYEDDPFQNYGGSILVNSRIISVIITESEHFVQAYDVKSFPAGGALLAPALAGGTPPPPPQCPDGSGPPCVKNRIRY